MIAAGVGVVVVAGGGAALAATAQRTTRPVTAAVTTGSITQTVDASGTIAASTTTAVNFATDGTVAEVDVTSGEVVRKGQALATLDTASLQSNVDSANSALARAKQTLESDQNGQTSSTPTGTNTGANSTSTGVGTNSASETPLTNSSPTTPSSPPSSTGSPPSAGSGSGAGSTATLSGLIRQIQSAQKAVVSAQIAVDKNQAGVDAAQQIVDTAITTNTGLRDAQQTACGTTTATSSTPSATSADPSASADCTSARANYEAYADTLSADSAALDAAIGAQDEAIKSLDTAIASLDGLLAKLPQAAAGSTSSGTGGGTTGSGSLGGNTGGSGSSPTGSGTTGGGSPTSSSTTQVASASQLAADQASIDSAEAQLKVTKQDLSAATLTSPFTGKVASINFTVGTSSAGGSITILGTGNQTVTIDVPLSEIDQIKTGQPASIAVDGRTDALHGTVTKIGLLSSTSGSRTTFPVTVSLNDGSPSLHNGVGASVTVTTGSAAKALLVPNSAITTLGTRHTVTVVRDGKASTVAVTLGLTGAESTQVTAGLSAGEQVELADPTQGLPGSATSSTTNRFTGVFPGGGLPSGFRNFRPGG